MLLGGQRRKPQKPTWTSDRSTPGKRDTLSQTETGRHRKGKPRVVQTDRSTPVRPLRGPHRSPSTWKPVEARALARLFSCGPPRLSWVHSPRKRLFSPQRVPEGCSVLPGLPRTDSPSCFPGLHHLGEDHDGNCPGLETVGAYASTKFNTFLCLQSPQTLRKERNRTNSTT